MPELVPPASAWLRHIVFTALILTSAAPAAAQKFDTTYVEEIPTRYRINTGLRYDDNSATFSTLDGREFRLENRRLAFRIGGRYGIPSYTFSIPLSDLGTGTDEENGDSWGLGIRLFRRYGYLRSQFRFTDGFRLTQPDGQSVFRDDIKLFTAFVYAYHLLNGRRYSLRSSFNQRDRQRVSQGSFLVGGLGTRKRLLADGLLLPQSKAGDLNLMRFAQTTLGVGGGYAYTKVIRDNFFITPFLYGGPEVQVANVQQVEERRKAQAVKLGFQYRARLSIGYHGGNKFAALIGDFIPSRTNRLICERGRNKRRSLSVSAYNGETTCRLRADFTLLCPPTELLNYRRRRRAITNPSHAYYVPANYTTYARIHYLR